MINQRTADTFRIRNKFRRVKNPDGNSKNRIFG